MSSGSGPNDSRVSNVGSSRGESWRLGGAGAGAAGGLAAAWGFGDAPVDADVSQGQADHAVVGVEDEPLQQDEYAQDDPFVAAAADGGRRAGRVGDLVVRAAEH